MYIAYILVLRSKNAEKILQRLHYYAVCVWVKVFVWSLLAIRIYLSLTRSTFVCGKIKIYHTAFANSPLYILPVVEYIVLQAILSTVRFFLSTLYVWYFHCVPFASSSCPFGTCTVFLSLSSVCSVLETHLRSKKILVSKQLCCRMHNHMRATDLCHIALVYTYNQPRLNKPITISFLCEA
jgi:hypothetical protein